MQASCRRNFSLDVVLLDAFSHPVNKEMEVKLWIVLQIIDTVSNNSRLSYSEPWTFLFVFQVVASLQYADNGLPVEKPNDAEAPLLTSYDGIEFASSARPSKLIHGRATFKLKISQVLL